MLQLTKSQSIVTLATYLVAFGIVIALGIQKNISISLLTNDPASLSSMPFYVGIISNIGIIFWTAAAGICLFTASLRHVAANARALLLCVGLLTLLFMLDDQFMIHEDILPNYLHLSSIFLYGLYALALAVIFIMFFKLLMAYNAPLLLLPFAFFAASVAAGAIGQNILTDVNPLLLKYGSKFIGILGWFLYFTLFSHFVAQQPSGMRR